MNPLDISLASAYFGKTPPRQEFRYHANGQIEYHGLTQRGRATSQAEWYVTKSIFNANGQVISVLVAPPMSIFDNYATLSYK